MAPTSPEGPSGLLTAAYTHTFRCLCIQTHSCKKKKSLSLTLIYHTAVLTLIWVAAGCGVSHLFLAHTCTTSVCVCVTMNP